MSVTSVIHKLHVSTDTCQAYVSRAAAKIAAAGVAGVGMVPEEQPCKEGAGLYQGLLLLLHTICVCHALWLLQVLSQVQCLVSCQFSAIVCMA